LIVMTAALMAAGTGAWLVSPAAEPPVGNEGIHAFMRMKLDASSKILEGLATEDFALIRSGAEKLQSMSAAEKWSVKNDVLYRQYSTEFRQHADKLLETAKSRNLDGSTLAWIECTMSCVRCHKHVRGIKVAGN